MTETEKQSVYHSVCALYKSRYGEDHMSKGSCLYWANCGGTILRNMGFRVLPQAGSMQWPILPESLDDGETPTHFTYLWSPNDPLSAAALALGDLPEIHVWLGLPETNEIVDFSTKFLSHQAEECGLNWQTPLPPDFLWTKADELPEQVHYVPNMDAIAFVLRRMLPTHEHAH